MIVYIYNIGVDLYNGFNGLRHRINWTYFTVLDGLAHPLYSLYQQNSLAFDILILPTIKIMLSKAFDIIENNLHYYDSFEQGLNFQKEYTLDSFTKALQLEEIRSMNDETTYFQMVNAFLIVYGYKYEYEDDKWIK